MRVFLNPGHDLDLDPGACGHGLRECDVAHDITALLGTYLAAAGVEIAGIMQSDDLDDVCDTANRSGADIFISIHCNAVDNPDAQGTETLVFERGGDSEKLAAYVQDQIVNSLMTVDRGIKERPGLYVLRSTDMPAILVETAFISNEADASKLRDRQDDFARAIARGVTDYIGGETEDETPVATAPGSSKYFSPEELMCHGAGQGHCDCGVDTAGYVSPRLLEFLDRLRENIGGPLEISCAYRCPAHNAAVGGVANSQHVYGTAADIQTPNYEHCNTPEQLLWYCEQLPFDGIGLYEWGCHVDIRYGGENSGIRW